MPKEFKQIVWNDSLLRDWERILDLAIAEDLGTQGDLTSLALVPEVARGKAEIVVRQPGILAGAAAIAATMTRFDAGLRWSPTACDGELLSAGQSIGLVEGRARAMLAAERPVLNLIGRLSGMATLTRRYVDVIAGTQARIYDTRKTTPGWRTLEKYAVHCGGGKNHRGGLYEAVLIKDNHLALVSAEEQLVVQPGLPRHKKGNSLAEAVVRARQFLAARFGTLAAQMIVEIEVDTLEQLDDVLAARPDIVLLDNMSLAMLREAVARRNAQCPEVELEASGGIHLETVRAVAETGVERISSGALTHSSIGLDLGLDWR